jgi:DNA-binding FadR family transcriptional regulator
MAARDDTTFPSPEAPGERSYQRLAAEILSLIAAGEFQPGERLPAERALAERLQVSRTAVREAIIALELQGTVEVRGGSGIYVCVPGAVAAKPAYMPTTGAGPFELLHARRLIESEIAAQSATTRKDVDLDRIFSALSDMREHMHDKATNEEADRQFHLRIAESTGNGVLLQMVTAMWDHAKGPIWTRADQHFHTTELRMASQADHQRVFDALLQRNAAAAKAAMEAHLDRVITEFARAWR